MVIETLDQWYDKFRDKNYEIKKNQHDPTKKNINGYNDRLGTNMSFGDKLIIPLITIIPGKVKNETQVGYRRGLLA